MSKIGRNGILAEKRTAKRIGGRLRPASGAMEGAKGDIELERYLVESKTTERNSIAIQHEWLAKIAHEARGQDRNPALAVTFVDGRGQPVRDGAWVMVPEWLWQELKDALEVSESG